MKTLIKVLFVAIGAMLLICYSCDKKENDPDDTLCEENVQPSIDRSFKISAVVTYIDGDAYEGDLVCQIRKIYCGGDIPSAGNHVLNGATDANGYYSVNYIYGYKFENNYDRVEVSFSIQGDIVKSEEFYYIDVEDFPNGTLTKTYDIVLTY